MQSEVSVIHHRTTYDDGLSSHSSGKMVAMHRIKKHGKQTPVLWIILSVVMTVGFATLYSNARFMVEYIPSNCGTVRVLAVCKQQHGPSGHFPRSASAVAPGTQPNLETLSSRATKDSYSFRCLWRKSRLYQIL